MERAVMDADERSHDTYSLLPPTIRQQPYALTMTYGGTATDLVDAEPIQNKRTMQPMDHDMPTWDELTMLDDHRGIIRNASVRQA